MDPSKTRPKALDLKLCLMKRNVCQRGIAKIWYQSGSRQPYNYLKVQEIFLNLLKNLQTQKVTTFSTSENVKKFPPKSQPVLQEFDNIIIFVMIIL